MAAAADPTRPEGAGAHARRFFEDIWSDNDPWDLETSALDQARYARQLGLLADRRYGNAVEIGCGAGSFTRHLAPLCDRLLAFDIAHNAIRRARGLGLPGHVTFRAADAMEWEPGAEGPWNLIVLAETAYYFGWLHPLFDVAWLFHAIHGSTAPGGRLLLVNTVHDDNGIMSPWLVRSYRDIVANAGFIPEAEEVLTGTKQTVEFDILLTLFTR